MIPKGLSQPAKPARTSLYQRHNPHNPIQAGKAGEPPATSKFLPTTTKPAKPARSPLFQRNSSHIPAKPAKPARPPASYQQVTSKLKYEAKTPLQMRQLKIGHFGVKPPASYRQVTSKLNYAQKGLYFIYLGAVLLSNGLIKLRSTANLMRRETLPDDDIGIPNLSLSEAFVKAEL